VDIESGGSGMAITPEKKSEGIRFLSDEESHQLFDAEARRLMNMSGEEFLRRYDAGEFQDQMDGPLHHNLVALVMLIPLGR
jgi:hypothetical protein